MLSLVKRKRKFGTFYYIRHTVDGKRTEHACNTTNRKHAEAIFREYQRGLLDIEEAQAQECVTFDDIAALYSEWSQTHHRPATRAQYLWAIKTFSETCPSPGIAHITPRHIQDFIRKRSQPRPHPTKKDKTIPGASPRTINATIIALKAVMNHAIEMQWYTGANPFDKVKRLKQPKRHVKWLNKDQIEAVLLNAWEFDQNAILIFALGIYAGLRKGEIVEARWEWFDWDAGLLHVRSSDSWVLKDNEDRTLPIHTKLKDLIYSLRKPSGYIVAPEMKHGKKKYRFDIRRTFRWVILAADVPWCTPHILRHTFASQLASAGVSLKKIGVWMGHSGSAITDIYAHLQLEDEDINSF